jgi:hypothetical protein
MCLFSRLTEPLLFAVYSANADGAKMQETP